MVLTGILVAINMIKGVTMESLTAEIISQTVESESLVSKSVGELYSLIRSYREKFTYEEYQRMIIELKKELEELKLKNSS